MSKRVDSWPKWKRSWLEQVITSGEVPQPAADPWEPIEGMPLDILVIACVDLKAEGNPVDVWWIDEFRKKDLIEKGYTHYSEINLPSGEENNNE